MDRTSKLNIFQDIQHFYVHSLSSILAVFTRSVFVISCLLLSFFVLTTTLLSPIDNAIVINIDPIINTGLLFSLVFITLLLVSYLSVMMNNNPARQKMAFFLSRVNTPNEYFSCAEARCTKRCRAPFFRFR